MYSRILTITALPATQSLFLFGPRTTGKSTLIRDYLQNQKNDFLIYDLLKTDEFLRLQTRPALLRSEIESKLKTMAKKSCLQVHIDEVQKITALLDEVHYLIEAHPGKLRFILSGSSARKLRRGGANLLAGRAWERFLYPLTCIELGGDFQLTDALRFGTLPSVCGKSELEKTNQLQTYVNTYLREEIQSEAVVRRLDQFHRFLEAAAHGNGELVNMTAVGQEAMVSRKTVVSYYEVLQDTLMGFFLPSWGRRQSRKELVAHGKFYFFDTGVVNALTRNLSLEPRSGNSLFGRQFEHYCILEFMRLHSYKNTEQKIGFFRTAAGAEVDLIAEKNGQIRAIEIKAMPTVTPSQIRGLLSFGQEFPKAERIVVCTTPRTFDLGGVVCMNWREFFQKEWEA